MTDIELLPLPEPMQVLGDRGRDAADAWCRANVALATAAKNAEIERLRAEREVIVAEAVKYADKSGRLEAKAERLAEALRRAEGLLRSAGIIAESDLERPHSAATEIKNALRDHDQEDEK